jgi:hypothetical protein
MQYYAGERDIRALEQISELAGQLQDRVASAQSSAREVVDYAPDRADNPELRDAAQADYDSHQNWVVKLSEDLHTAATKLP